MRNFFNKGTASERSPLLKKSDSIGSDLEVSKGPVKLQRTIGIISAALVVFGNCVGAGIFISPKGVFEQTGSAGAGMIVFAVAGIIATLCNLAYAELGLLMPSSGGEFVYIRKAYGNLPAFLFSFCNSFVIKPASTIVVVLTFSEYLATLIWGEIPTVSMSKIIALCTVLFIIGVNMINSGLVIKFCSFSSFIKMSMVVFLIVCGVTTTLKGKGHLENFHSNTTFIGSATSPTKYSLAFYFAAFSYQSWNSLNYITEELKNPTRTLPIGGFLGMLGTSVCYVLCNVSYLLIFSTSDLIATNTIAMDCGKVAFGRIAEIAMCVGLLFSCLGAASGGLLCVSRNIQSTAQEGVFPRWMGSVNPTLKTPIPALMVLCTTMSLYLAVDVNVLIPCLSTVEWSFYCLTFSSLIYLRVKDPTAHRPVKIPLFIAVFLLFVSFAFVILPLFNASSRIPVLIGMSSLPIGCILYGLLYLTRRYLGRDPWDEKPRKPLLNRSASESSIDSGHGSDTSDRIQ